MVGKEVMPKEPWTLMLHEFLYLICNSNDRIHQIKDNFKPKFASEKEVIEQWELHGIAKVEHKAGVEPQLPSLVDGENFSCIHLLA